MHVKSIFEHLQSGSRTFFNTVNLTDCVNHTCTTTHCKWKPQQFERCFDAWRGIEAELKLATLTREVDV